ncbi:MAG TPA: low affinity iron permease family protein [Alphaproteobacteria bacterium]|nr:low affinity iron permease family protein [Alphaproteobacteria bacterium]
MKLNDAFFHFSRGAARHVGQPAAFVLAILVIAAWAITGPIFQWSDTWQLIINTGTTIVTFLMVFLIQNTQNRDSEAIHLKLDELIRATKRARNSLLDLEEGTEEEIKALREEFVKLAERKRLKQEMKEHQG